MSVWGSVITPVARLPLGSLVPHHAFCPVFMVRTMGLVLEIGLKQFNSIQQLLMFCAFIAGKDTKDTVSSVD